MNYKMASQAYQWMTDWMCMARGQRGVRAQWLLHSVNPTTGNASVAQGRVLHQLNVWHCLRQMLCSDVLLTFTTFWRNTSMMVCSTEEYFTIPLRAKCAACYPERCGGDSKLTERTEQIVFKGIYPFFLMQDFLFLLT